MEDAHVADVLAIPITAASANLACAHGFLLSSAPCPSTPRLSLQCSNTVKGLNCTDATTPGNYLDFNGIFDVIHFNYGLHDLENCNSTECSEHVDPVVYGQNLVTIYRRLAAKANTVIFATTTPVPNVTTSYGRTYELAVEYNTVALKALQGAVGSKLIVDDLWTTVINVCGTYYTNCTLQIPANVHFEPAGQQVLGQQVANTVLKNLDLQGWRQEKSGKWTKST